MVGPLLGGQVRQVAAPAELGGARLAAEPGATIAASSGQSAIRKAPVGSVSLVIARSSRARAASAARSSETAM